MKFPRFKAPFANRHRLLIGSGRYITVDKQFVSASELRDWLAVNTLLTDENISSLLAAGEVELENEGVSEWFKYMPPRKPEP
jgi:hypothetical protein